MKKLLAVALALALALPLASPAMADGFSGELTLWVAESTLLFTQAQVDAFIDTHPEYAAMTVCIEGVSEGDAADEMLYALEDGADLFCFAQDQLARLVSAGALSPLAPADAARVSAANDAGSVNAVTFGGSLYAYPLTSDNGYFLYYDSSVVTDPSTLEQILADCEAAGRTFYMDISSGWYQPAFFFGHGCELSFDYDEDGNLLGMNSSYASEGGLAALKDMIMLHKSPAFRNGSSIYGAENVAAIVDGTWDSDAAMTAFGSHYAAAKLPTVGGVQMSGFGGFKMMGVKPQADADRLAACHALAAWLTSEDAQLARFEAFGWGPSNLNAQADEAVQLNPALSALAAQLAFCKPQGLYPGMYWSISSNLASEVLSGNLDSATDQELMAVLQGFIDSFAPSPELVLWLPASLTEIGPEAFSGVAARIVVIPGSVTTITGNPFAGSDVEAIWGYPGSPAEQLALDADYSFTPIDDEWMESQ